MEKLVADSAGARLTATILYMGVLLGYAYWRSRVDDVPGAAVELAVIMVPSFLLGLALRSWWALLAPLAVVALVWVTLEGVGRPGRLDLLAYMVFLTVPPVWLAAGLGVVASRVAERYL